ncbi:MAG: hypothetical protein BWX84_03253 [Verrucomicrobia bacterium ADurb.Bin118]|nr:MAG: hypothetical protein BWX84_03253 [Verrucomicrobia bacterium ADurb.Bin118]
MKKIHRRGFATGRRRAVQDVAQEKKFVDVEGERRFVRVFGPVVNRRELARFHPESGFLESLALHRFREGIVHVRPPARQRPQSIGRLAHQQHLIIAKYRRAHIHLGGGVAVLQRKQLAECRGRGGVLQRHQFGGDVGGGLIALAVVIACGVGETRLRQRLELPGQFPKMRFRSHVPPVRAEAS